VAETLLLDTSAIIAFIEDEPGADQVDNALIAADAGLLHLYCCFVTLTEVDYITRQERGEIIADQRMRDLRNLPIQWIHSDDALCSAAAKLKAACRISFADAFVAAAAMLLDATLVHKDPEFLPLKPNLKQTALPPKT
jgi:predicted nucleic acid-binding protein